MSARGPLKPSRRQVLIAGGLCGAGLAAGAAAVFDPSLIAGFKTSDRKGVAFGTIVALKAAHEDAGILEASLDAAWAEMVRVEMAASLFRPQSALSQLNRTGALDNPPALLVDMLKQAIEVAELTGGAFDPTVQPLWLTYDRAYAAGRTASADEVATASALMGWRDISVSHNRIALARPGMALTLNGIGQGFATERCLAVLAGRGISHAFLDTGEIGATGKREGTGPWTAAIADPRRKGECAALARPLHGVLATSGDYATVWSDDYSHHHILDPQTRRSPPVLASVSVIAPCGGLADGLSTAMMVLGPEKSLALARSLPGVEALLITKSGEHAATAGFPLA
jgi:thiamine biosynthesis lipoprotein